MRPPRSLRKLLTVTTLIVAVLAGTAAAALVVATGTLRRMTDEATAAVESVRLVEEGEVDLLLYARAVDPAVKAKLATRLHATLGDASTHTADGGEEDALADARARVDDYLAAASTGAPATGLDARAFAALDRLVGLIVAQARGARDAATSWTRVANIFGVILAGTIVAITAGIVLWLRRRVILPLFALAETVKRFGEGERTARAEARGPLELREMSQRFNEMADAIARQREAQSAFLGGIAHDLRTPLSALQLAADLLGPDQPLPPEPQLRHRFAIIRRQIGQLARMAGDFLDLARLEAGQLALQIGPHDVRAIVRDTTELFGHAERARFELAMADEPVVAACDPVRIGQVTANLISNAIKYAPANTTIRIAVARHEAEALLEVSDRGPGIPAHEQQQIFEPFRRRRHDEAIPGVGLGLYNVKRLVEAHRGRVELDSAPGRGTTFRVRLPRALAEDTTPARPQPQPSL